MEKKIAILGSTGSIGEQTLQVVDKFPEKFRVWALSCRSSVKRLKEQVLKYRPEVVVVYDDRFIQELASLECQVLVGMEGLKAMAQGEYDIFVSAAMGAIAIEPTYEAIKAGKRIALANKECLVSAGNSLMEAVGEFGAEIIPVDSEHNALFQCTRDPNRIMSKAILTASGGPFWNADLDSVSVDEALSHPTWKMGKKITIDSSTMMNKGFEVIEAYHLFGLEANQIEVVVHPQSIVHAMAEFNDGSVIAQMSYPDMRLPIEYALHYPKSEVGLCRRFDFTQPHRLEFYPPDTKKFPCLRLAYEALQVGGSLPCFMNATNEILVERFLNKEISWHDIPRLLEELMARHEVIACETLEEVLFVDNEVRKRALV